MSKDSAKPRDTLNRLAGKLDDADALGRAKLEPMLRRKTAVAKIVEATRKAGEPYEGSPAPKPAFLNTGEYDLALQLAGAKRDAGASAESPGDKVASRGGGVGSESPGEAKAPSPASSGGGVGRGSSGEAEEDRFVKLSPGQGPRAPTMVGTGAERAAIDAAMTAAARDANEPPSPAGLPRSGSGIRFAVIAALALAAAAIIALSHAGNKGDAPSPSASTPSRGAAPLPASSAAAPSDRDPRATATPSVESAPVAPSVPAAVRTAPSVEPSAQAHPSATAATSAESATSSRTANPPHPQPSASASSGRERVF